MNNNINKKLESLLSGMNEGALKNSRQGIEQILNSPKCKKLANEMSDADKNKIINMFMNMDNDEIKRKLKNVKMSDLSKISADDIINRLK